MSDLNTLLGKYRDNRASLEAEELYALVDEMLDWAESAQDLANSLSESVEELGIQLGAAHDETLTLRSQLEQLEAVVVKPVEGRKAGALTAGWKEAAIAWEVCASIHRKYAEGKDPLFTSRQTDFTNSHHECKDNINRAHALIGNGSFDKAWHEMEAVGFQFSTDNIEKVRIGWDMLVDKLIKEN